MRVLIADDDARFLGDLRPYDRFSDHMIVGNLADAMRLIDRRRKWDAAIFDRYLSDDGLPFESGRLVRDAGFLLAVAFHEKSPEGRSVIATGSPDFSRSNVPDNIQRLENPHLCQHISKHILYVDPYGKPSDGMNAMIRFLRGETDTPYAYRKEFLDHLVLQPNFCGLGIDLRKVIDTIWEYVTRTGSPNKRIEDER